jgi:hypothetical protein
VLCALCRCAVASCTRNSPLLHGWDAYAALSALCCAERAVLCYDVLRSCCTNQAVHPCPENSLDSMPGVLELNQQQLWLCRVNI